MRRRATPDVRAAAATALATRDHFTVEDAGDDIVFRKRVGRQYGGDGLGGGQFHRLVDLTGLDIEGPAENSRKRGALLIWLG